MHIAIEIADERHGKAAIELTEYFPALAHRLLHLFVKMEEQALMEFLEGIGVVGLEQHVGQVFKLKPKLHVERELDGVGRTDNGIAPEGSLCVDISLTELLFANGNALFLIGFPDDFSPVVATGVEGAPVVEDECFSVHGWWVVGDGWLCNGKAAVPLCTLGLPGRWWCLVSSDNRGGLLRTSCATST